MGLVTGDKGVKNLIKSEFPNSVRSFDSIESARIASGHRAEQAAVLLDGNVMINQVPTAVDDIDGYIRIFSGYVRAGLAAADHVVVVFDEPQTLTKAKAAEQRRRDASRSKTVPVMSTDLEDQFAPTTDSYGVDVVERCNPHHLLKNRAARPRFYDELVKRTMQLLDVASTHKMLTFDGIDGRGAARPSGVDREAGMFSSSSGVAALLARSADAAPVGEGDLKLTEVSSVIQALRNDGIFFDAVEIIFVCTIDTDSIAIELINQTTKTVAAIESKKEGTTTGRMIKSVLCFRETSGKRSADQFPSTTFACIDLAILERLLMKKLFGASWAVHHDLHRHAAALLVAGWALGGCDFVRLAGLRADVVMETVVEIAQTEPESLRQMDAAFSLTRASTPYEVAVGRADMASAVEQLLEIAAVKLGEMPRMQRACASVKAAEDDVVAKASWVVCYWCGLEFTEIEEWGFD